MSIEEKPIIGITMGDPAGIGPEVIVRALSFREIYEVAKPIVIGDSKVLKLALKLTKLKHLNINSIQDVSEAEFRFGTIDIIDLDNVSLRETKIGKISAEAGKASIEYIIKAVNLALKGVVDAICTGPISKEAINKAGYQFSGHTELLKELTGAKHAVMMLAVRNLKVSHVTTHVALRKVCEIINKERILTTIKITNEGLIRYFGIKEPRIGVAALNPHAGEGGLFGSEEIEIISPAIEEANRVGIKAFGPLPADTIFYRAVKGDFDAVIAMYHDQGHIPVKLLGFHEGVNITLGLPIIRTSVDHGTAFDIAGKGIAHPGSMVNAIKYAALMVRNDRRWRGGREIGV